MVQRVSLPAFIWLETTECVKEDAIFKMDKLVGSNAVEDD
jgi:hypothetical protein